jgi:hypothetical protein
MGMYRDIQQGKGGYDGNFMAINGYQWFGLREILQETMGF